VVVVNRATTNADLAKLNEKRKKYGLSLVLHPDVTSVAVSVPVLRST
jgi:hypothetical protein